MDWQPHIHGIHRAIQKHSLIFCLCWICLWSVPLSAAPLHFDIIMSRNASAYQEVADRITQQVKQGFPGAIIVHHDLEHDRPEGVNAQLVVTIGVQAAEWALSQPNDTPVLATLIPQDTYESISANLDNPGQHEHSAIFLDQPIYRQINLLTALFPRSRTVSTLLGPLSIKHLPELQRLATENNLSLASASMMEGDNVIKKLRPILNDTDVFLATPDPVVFNRQSLPAVLLTTYRSRTPVIGFSHAYVNAGALAATYSTPEQIGRQTAEHIDAWLIYQQEKLPPPSHPKYFSVAINQQVAQSLGIRLPDIKEVELQLQQLEGIKR